MTEINLSNILNNIDHQDKNNGLYIVATPIGNILDLTLRALFILENVDIIYAEDTRVTRKLLSFYGISKKIVSCNEHNAAKMSVEIVSFLSNNMHSAALVSDAGTPLVSDPGYMIVAECIKNDIYVTSLPGPCSVVNALVLSGYFSGDFYFHGFLPYKSVGRKNELFKLKNYKTLIVILESPYRICKCLEDIKNVFDNVNIAILREMTKKFEEIKRGRINDIDFSDITSKGEFVLVIDNRE